MLNGLSNLALLSMLMYSVQAGAALTELEADKMQLTTPVVTNWQEYKFKDIKSMKDIWVNFPQIAISNSDLENKIREIEFLLFVDETGLVRNVQILKSTGLENLDNKIIDSLKSGARTKVMVNYGKPYKFTGIQKIVLYPE